MVEWLALDHSWDQECNEPYNTGHSGDLQKKAKDAASAQRENSIVKGQNGQLSWKHDEIVEKFTSVKALERVS